MGTSCTIYGWDHFFETGSGSEIYTHLNMNLFFSKNVQVDLLTMIAASPNQVQNNTAFDFLEPTKMDLIENLFDNYECGDVVSCLFFYYVCISIYLKTVQAHGALHLAFHDAIGFSPKLG